MLLKDNYIGPHHIGIKSGNNEELSNWYQSVLGYELVSKHMVKKDPDLQITFLKCGNLTIELIQNGDGKNVDQLSHGHIDHFAMRSSHPENAMLAFKKKNIPIFEADGDKPAHLANFFDDGVSYVVGLSPNGEKVEVSHIHGQDNKANPMWENWAHLGIPLVNLEESTQFYEKLGFAVSGSGYVDTDDGRIKANFLKQGDLQLELYQLVGEGLKEIKTRQHGIIDHIAIEVKDLPKALIELKENGLAPDNLEISTLDFSGKAYQMFFIYGPMGEKIEISQVSD